MTNENIEKMFSEFVPLLKSVCGTYDSNPERSTDIILKRFGFLNEDKRTLEEIGQYYGVTRERVRQIEEKLLSIFVSLVTTGKYVKKFKVKEIPYFLESSFYKQITNFIESLSLNKFYLLTSQIEKITHSAYDDFKYKGELDFLLLLLDYRKLTGIQSHFELEEGWCYTPKSDLVENVIHTIEAFFRQDSTQEIQLFDLVLSLRKQNLNITESEVIDIIHLVSGITLNNDNNSIKFDSDHLALIDKAYLYLKENGPTNLTELTRIMNIGHYRIVREGNLRNQMSQDERFSAIGKSGKWQLKNDKDSFENITIAGAMERILHKLGKPLGVEQLCEQIKRMRGASFKEKSIRIYANTDARFVFINGEVALSIWNLDIPEKKKREPIGDFCKELSAFLPLNQDILLNKIVEHFLSHSWKEQTIRSKLKKLREAQILIDIENSPLAFGPNKVVRLIQDPNQLGYSPMQRVLIRDRIQNEVIELLKDTRLKLTKGELYLKLNKKVKCVKGTFYSYLSDLEGHPHLKFTKNDNKFYVEYLD